MLCVTSALLLFSLVAGLQPCSALASTPECPAALSAPARPVRHLSEYAADDYGRPGLSHITLWGAVHHGMKEVEVWLQTFAPGSGTPIHRHHCEEVFLVLRGSGTLFLERSTEGGTKQTALETPLDYPVDMNTTFFIAPNLVHQVRNTEASGDLQLLVIISKPPIRVYTYKSWTSSREAAEPSFPYPWDRVCPSDSDIKERLTARTPEL